MKRRKGLLDEEKFLPPLPEQLPRGASSLFGYGQGPGMQVFQEAADVGRGLFGVTPIIEGGEGYRTGQALANIPPVAGALGVVKAPTKAAKIAEHMLPTAKTSPVKPLRLYHGTDKDFRTFDIDEAAHNVNGIWLTDSQGYADWISRKGDKKNKSGKVMPLDVEIKNPMVFDIFEEGKRVADEIGVPEPTTSMEAQELLSGGMGWDSVVSDLVHEAKLKGYDALKLERFDDNYGHETTAYVAFDPGQIKLVSPDIENAQQVTNAPAAAGAIGAGLLSPAVLEYLRRRDEEGM